MKNKIAILGGDLRQYTAALALNNNWDVHIWGFDNSKKENDGLVICKELNEAVDGAVGIVLPLPSSSDGICLNCPFSDTAKKVRLSEIIDNASSGCVMVGGKIPAEARYRAEARGMRVIDYFDTSRPYLNHELTINDIVNVLFTNKLYISKAISAYTGRNFCQFVNYYRVTYAVELFRKDTSCKRVYK